MKTLPINSIKQEYANLSSNQKEILLIRESARQNANSLMLDFMNHIPEPKDELGQYVKGIVDRHMFIKKYYNKIHESMKLRRFRVED